MCMCVLFVQFPKKLSFNNLTNSAITNDWTLFDPFALQLKSSIEHFGGFTLGTAARKKKNISSSTPAWSKEHFKRFYSPAGMTDIFSERNIFTVSAQADGTPAHKTTLFSVLQRKARVSAWPQLSYPQIIFPSFPIFKTDIFVCSICANSDEKRVLHW